jgi:uncharacterized protein
MVYRIFPTLYKNPPVKKIIFVCFLSLIYPFSLAQAPFILGVTDTLSSRIMGEKRILNIYLPEGYHEDSLRSYPVIYLLDGSFDEDFIHVAGLIQFFNFPWIERAPKSILVGIANTHRKKDFTFKTPHLKFLPEQGYDSTSAVYGGSDKFISFIGMELQPYIQRKYRVNTSKTLIGQSLGGLLATEIFLTKPILFDTYIILSPSLWWNDESLLKDAQRWLAMNKSKGTKVYIGIGNEGKTMIADAKKLYQLIKKYHPDTQVYYDFLKEEDHATMSHQALYNAFKLLYPKSPQ